MRYPYWLKVFMDTLKKDKASRKVKGNSVLIKQEKPVYMYPFMDGNLMTKRAWEQKKEERIKTNINNIGD